MADTTFSVRLSEELRAEVDAFARETRRSRSFIVKEAIEAHLADRRAYQSAIQEALVEVERGETIPGDEVIAWLESWCKPDELPPPSVRRSKAAS